MTTIVTRAGKGSPLSTLELDTNFTNLNTDKVEVGGALGTPSSGTATNLTGLPLTTGVTGTLPVANGGTGITSFGTGVATWLGTPSSANLAAAVTDETGTGALVFATNATLVTPALGTPASGVATNLTGLPLSTGVTGTLPVANGGTGLTSYTANGVVFASGTTTLASGSALTFDGTSKVTLQGANANYSVRGTSGSSTFFHWAENGVANRGVLGFAAGSATLAYRTGADGMATGTELFTVDASGNFGLLGTMTAAKFIPTGSSATGNGMYLPTANQLGFSINGSEAMRLTSTGLGIGTSAPGEKLDVVGTARVLRNTGATNTGDQNTIVAGAITSGAYAASYGAGLQFQITNSSGGYSGGRIVSRLGTDNNTANLVFQARNYGFTDSMTLDSSGNLGLGVTPSAWGSGQKAIQNGSQSVWSTNGANTGIGLNVYNDGGANRYIANGAANLYQQDGAHSWYTAPSGTAGNAITFTQAMTLDASGRLLIGLTSNASNGAVQAAINGTGTSFQTNAAVFSALSTVVGREIPMMFASDTTNAALISQLSGNMAFFTQTTERARITSDGFLRMASGSGGIQFNGDTAAANALDDYEEGTWTPSLGGTATYTARSGKYTKIGNVVHLTGSITVNVLGTGSTNTLSGIPFAIGDTDYTSGSVGYADTLAVNSTAVRPYYDPGNSSALLFVGGTDANTGVAIQLAIFGDSARIHFTIQYITS